MVRYRKPDECGAGKCDCCHAPEVGRRKASKSGEKRQHLLHYWHVTGQPLLGSEFALLHHHLSEEGEFIGPLWLICSSLLFFSFFHLLFAGFFPSFHPHQDDGFCKRSCHPPTQPFTRRLFTPENAVCDESELPPRKLAVDSHLISLWVDNWSVPITPVFIVAAPVSWQEPFWSGWMGME